MKTKKSNLKATALITGALLVGTATAVSAAGNTNLLSFSALGSGAELRTSLLNLNNSSFDASQAVNNERTAKFSELKCGEGKCGEGKCGEDKKGDAKKDSTETKSNESKASESKSGEESKKEEKSE